MPWNTVFRSGESSDLEVDELPPSLKAAACAAGIQSVWIRPVEDRRGDVGAVFLAWLDEAGAATANQARHLDEVVRVAGLAMDHHEQRTRLNAAALMDSLTGLGNRFHLSQLLTADDAPAAALYVDLDGFKSVNDTYGHNVGDVVLTLAGRRIAALVRESDAVFRMGGDEFVVIFGELPGDPGCVVDGGHTVATIAQRIVDALAEPFEVAGNDNLLIGASVGIATRQPGDSGDQLIRRSDRALLHAKSSGKSRWHQAETD